MSIILYNFFLFVYKAGIRLVSPWNEKARLWINGRKQFPAIQNKEKMIWMHCASLGEFEQGRPLLEAIRKDYPGHQVALSFYSPSGYEVCKNYPGADSIFYLPSDNATHAKKLIDLLNPSLVVWVKYEYWYYYLKELKERKIPVLLISGTFRKNQPFFRWYGSIWRKMLQSFDHLFVQDEDSLNLLKGVGLFNNVQIGGDTRFDRVTEIAEKNEPVEFISSFVGHHQLLVAGSTWREDEIELLHFVKSRRDIKFIIAPHEIYEENLQKLQSIFEDSIFYSSLKNESNAGQKAHVLIIDNIGMLARLYQYADVTYVGGGFGNEGIHNVLEAAVFGKPVVFGPVYEKYAEASGLIHCGAAFSISSPLELEKILNLLFNEKEVATRSGLAAKNFVYAHQGATKKIMEHIYRNRLLIN